MKRAALAVLLLAAACGRRAPEELAPVRETVAGVDLVDYDPPKGTYACRAPARWAAEEDARYDDDGVSFVAPAPAGGVPAVITISRYPNKTDKAADAAAYAKSFWELDGKEPAVERRDLGGRTALVFTREAPLKTLHTNKLAAVRRVDIALVPVPGGFFRLEHAAPRETAAATLPVFEAVLRSFAPKP